MEEEEELEEKDETREMFWTVSTQWHVFMWKYG